jgi:hypothetical protein
MCCARSRRATRSSSSPDRLLDLVLSTDHRVDLPLAGGLRHVSAVLVERLCLACRPAALLDAADDGAAELRMRDPEAREQLACRSLGVERQGEQHVLRPDVRRAELAGLLVGGQERRLRVRRERRRNVGALVLIGLVLDLSGYRLGIGVDLAEHVLDDVVLERRPQQVIGVEIQAPPLERLLRRPLE